MFVSEKRSCREAKASIPKSFSPSAQEEASWPGIIASNRYIRGKTYWCRDLGNHRSDSHGHLSLPHNGRRRGDDPYDKIPFLTPCNDHFLVISSKGLFYIFIYFSTRGMLPDHETGRIVPRRDSFGGQHTISRSDSRSGHRAPPLHSDVAFERLAQSRKVCVRVCPCNSRIFFGLGLLLSTTVSA